MKARKILTFALCFVLLISALVIGVSAKGAEPTESFKEVTNSDGTVTTKYGKIPKSYASVDSYPFAVFKYKNGSVDSVSGSATMKSAVDTAKSWNNTWSKLPQQNGKNVNDTENTYSSVIVLRKNYTVVKYTDKNNAGDKYDNYAQLQNECIIDLNGYTLTDGGSGIFFQVTSKGSSSQGYIFDTTYTVKNGKIAINKTSVFYGNMWDTVAKVDGYTITDKDFTFNFDNVTFEYVAKATATNMLISYVGPQDIANYPPTVAAPYYFNYTNCTFDVSNAPSGAVTLFNAAPSDSQYIKTTVTVTGCEIKDNSAGGFANLILQKTESKFGSSVTLAADENGDVLTLSLPEGEYPTVPTSSYYVNANGKKLYWHKAESGVFALSECLDSASNHACTCGVIYTDCTDENSDNVCDVCGAVKMGGTWLTNESASQYPFVILDKDGAYNSVQTTWKMAIDAATKLSGSTVVMRGNYTNTTFDASTNLKAYAGEITVDLNGYTLTRGYDGAYIFDNWWDDTTTSDTVKVTIKNGTILVEKWLICLSGNAAIANAKQADFNFEDVNFKFAAKNDKTGGWLIVVHNQSYNKTITTNIEFTDCKFDTTDMRSSIGTDAAPVLQLNVNNASGVDYVKANVTFNGGEFIANRFVAKSLYKVHSDDVVTFNKGESGEYMTLTMPEGKAPTTPASSDYFTVGGAKTYFHKTGDIYKLSECLDPATHHECTCGFVFSTDCVDADKNHVCDICKDESDCIDENKDHVCDLCDKTLTCEECDVNRDHVCDSCEKAFDCTDANKDEICDHCGYVINDYGIKNIDPAYASTSKYPFFVLKYQNGKYSFVAACEKFYGSQSSSSAVGKANTTIQSNNKYDLEKGEYVPEGSATGVATAVIVMRRDYSLKMGNKDKAGTEYFDNIAHAQGDIIVDLGGHTLSEASGSNKAIFTVTAKGWPDSADGVFTFPFTYTFKNGKLNALKYAIASVGTSDVITERKPECTIEDAPFTLNFENVTFGYAEGATSATLAYTTGGATNKYASVAKVNVNFKDCTFDLMTNAPDAEITIINNDTTGKDVDCDLTVEGCEILASDMANVTVYKSSTANGSSTVFKADADGNYITLKMPEGAPSPALEKTVVIENGAECVFVKSGSEGEYDSYKLYPAVMVGYKVKTSVTLYSNLVYNIYIPKAGVESFTVNGSAMEYKTVTIDEVEYYHVAVNLPAGAALSDIALKVTLASGSTTVDAKWTLSVFKYAKSVLLGECDEVTETLMKDMLAYASAAHTYFKTTEGVENKLSEIEALLAGYEREMPEGEAKQPSDSTYFKSAVVHLGEIPSFRFYFADGYDASCFTFTVGGRAVDVTVSEDGKYVEIAMYAYRMLDDVTFTVTASGESENYNLYSYYQYVTDTENNTDANLVNIVEALIKYAESAADYRNSVINN